MITNSLESTSLKIPAQSGPILAFLIHQDKDPMSFQFISNYLAHKFYTKKLKLRRTKLASLMTYITFLSQGGCLMKVCELIVKYGAIFLNYTYLQKSSAPSDGGQSTVEGANRRGMVVSFLAFLRGKISKHEHYPESQEQTQV